MLASYGSAMAQSFNTITSSRPSRKVVRTVINTQKEEPLDSDTSLVSAPLHIESVKEVAAKQTEQTRYPLSVSYPLRQSKLHISSPYGWRIHPMTHKRKFYAGVDLRAHYEPVYAMLPGEVINTGFESKGGNFISLRHGNIKVTYCHLSYIGVKKGTIVHAGQPIGVSGNSGQYTTGPHLHLGVKDIKPINSSFVTFGSYKSQYQFLSLGTTAIASSQSAMLNFSLL